MKKTILITGSTDGIGKQTALDLAKQGHKIYIHGRSFEKVNNTIEEIKKESGNQNIKGFLGDLSDLNSVKNMINEIKEKLNHIDVLINNAGVFKAPNQDNEKGLDLRIVVNYISAYLITKELIPLLEKSTTSRVISLSSAAQAPIIEEIITGKEKSDTNNTYAQSKLAIAFMSKYFSQIYKNINFISVNPGSLLATKMAFEAYGTTWSKIEKGSDILTDLSILEKYKNDSGKYFDNDNGSFGNLYGEEYKKDSLLLQVTVGCAHNTCTHCTMYRDVNFSIEKLEQIEKDIKEAKELYGTVKRVFLLNGDAFVLPASMLKDIATLIIEYFPEVEVITMYASIKNVKAKTEVITMYASIKNVKAKTDEELKELRKLRINELWMGIESGNKQTLKYLNVGYELNEAYIELKRLNKAGIKHIDNFILGGAGKGRGIQNAIDTAKLINETKTMAVSVTTLGAYGDSPLYKDVENGTFILATEREVLEEQRKLIELVKINTMYYGIHGINSITFDTKLPEQKEFALQKIDNALTNLDDNYLNGVPKRYSI